VIIVIFLLHDCEKRDKFVMVIPLWRIRWL